MNLLFFKDLRNRCHEREKTLNYGVHPQLQQVPVYIDAQSRLTGRIQGTGVNTTTKATMTVQTAALLPLFVSLTMLLEFIMRGLNSSMIINRPLLTMKTTQIYITSLSTITNTKLM